MTNRRDFIFQTAATGMLAMQGSRAAPAAEDAVPVGQAVKPLRMLILGGTGNIGPHFVRAALARGHRVSAFIWRREEEQASTPAGVERLLGDRDGDLESIKGRDWDAVLDLATFTPDWVRSLGEALGKRAGHYLFISTVSVYDHPELNERTRETSQVVDIEVSPTEKYGGNKIRAEREAERQFPDRAVVLRPGYIVGPGDRIGFLSFWPLRMQHGREVMVPGDALLPFQCIDVRDLANFAIHLAEQRKTGAFNAIGPASPTTLGQMVETARSAMSSSATLTWVPAARVAAQQDKATWGKTLFWSWHSYAEYVGQANIMRMSNERAVASGLAFRALSATLSDAMSWYRQQPADVQAAMAPGFKKPEQGEPSPSAEILWQRYLQREKEVLSAWHGRRVEL